MDPSELRVARARLGVTQIEMAELLGIGLRQYKRYEHGHRLPTTASLLLARLMEDHDGQ